MLISGSDAPHAPEWMNLFRWLMISIRSGAVWHERYAIAVYLLRAQSKLVPPVAEDNSNEIVSLGAHNCGMSLP